MSNKEKQEKILEVLGLKLKEKFILQDKKYPYLSRVYGYTNKWYLFDFEKIEGFSRLMLFSQDREKEKGRMFDLLSGNIEYTIFKEREKMKINEKFFYVDTLGEICHDYYKDDTLNILLVYMGNCFSSKEEAIENKDRALKTFELMKNCTRAIKI